MYVCTLTCLCISLDVGRTSKRGEGRVLLTEIPLPRSARQGTVCPTSIRGQARTTRNHKFEPGDGFQSCHPPFRPSELLDDEGALGGDFEGC